jgi:hypothetical protein
MLRSPSTAICLPVLAHFARIQLTFGAALSRRNFWLILSRSQEEKISDHREVLLFGPENSRKRNRIVEGDEPPGMFYCQGKEVKVGYLLGSADVRVIDDCLVENAQVVGPKFVVRGSRCIWRRLMTSPAGTGLGYLDCDMIRMHPFSVRGHDAQPEVDSRSNQLLALRCKSLIPILKDSSSSLLNRVPQRPLRDAILRDLCGLRAMISFPMRFGLRSSAFGVLSSLNPCSDHWPRGS